MSVVGDEPRLENVVGCARCGGNHVGLRFEPLANPIEANEKTTFAWWAPCPTSGQPILLAVYEKSFQGAWFSG